MTGGRTLFDMWKSQLVLLAWGVCLAGMACESPGGRRVADVHSPQQSVRPGINDPYEQGTPVTEWMERFEGESREVFRERHRIVERCGVSSGMAVADVGAGTGVFTLLFAEAVGEDGVVYAVDLVPEFLTLIQERAAQQLSSNVRTVLCSERSVTLAPESIDLAFICDTYHHFEYPRSTMASVHRALKPGGTVVVVDFDRVEGVSREWILDHVRAGRREVISEIEGFGFKLIDGGSDVDYLDENYILRFRKRGT